MIPTQVIHIGVAKPSGPHGAELVDLAAYVADADDHLRILAAELGVLRTAIFGTAATRHRVRDELDAAAVELRDGGLCVIAFTGHGGKIVDDDHDEVIDHRDESWCLDDNPLADDELSAKLAAFSDQTHVVVISNCCFAAGIDDGDPHLPIAKGGQHAPIPRGSPAQRRAARMAELRIRWIDAIRALDGSERDARLPGEPPRHRPIGRGEKNRVLAAVCASGQQIVAQAHSDFTRRILDTVFPPDDDGLRTRDRAVTYAVLEAALRAGATDPLTTPSVTGKPLDVPPFWNG